MDGEIEVVRRVVIVFFWCVCAFVFVYHYFSNRMRVRLWRGQILRLSLKYPPRLARSAEPPTKGHAAVRGDLQTVHFDEVLGKGSRLAVGSPSETRLKLVTQIPRHDVGFVNSW